MERHVRQTGVKKGHLVEQALLHHLLALGLLPWVRECLDPYNGLHFLYGQKADQTPTTKARMTMALPNEAELLRKIRALPAEKIAEVQDFVEFLEQRAQTTALSHAAARLAEPAFQKIWDNPDDAAYDEL